MANTYDLLWEINHPDLSRPSYLLGTMHVRNSSAFIHQQLIQQRILQCDAYAGEYALNPESRQVDPQLFLLDPPQTLQSYYGEKKYNRLKERIQKCFQVDLRQHQQTLPIFIISLIDQQILKEDHPFFLDEYLWQFAEGFDRTMMGIEQFEEQCAILAKIPLEYQFNSLKWISKNHNRYRRQLNRMAQLYERGALQQIYKAARRSAGKLRKLLIFDRNIIMADRIGVIVKEQSTFIAIGAGHLGGKSGVLRLLKLKGYQLRPTKISAAN